MSWSARVPRDAAARKPAHGRPCNGCGVCCMASLCPLAQHVFGPRPGPCPALALEEGSVPPTYACGLVVDPAIPVEMREAAKLLVGTGTGCDARIGGEPADALFYARLLRLDAINAARVKAAKLLWGAE